MHSIKNIPDYDEFEKIVRYQANILKLFNNSPCIPEKYWLDWRPKLPIINTLQLEEPNGTQPQIDSETPIEAENNDEVSDFSDISSSSDDESDSGDSIRSSARGRNDERPPTPVISQPSTSMQQPNDLLADVISNTIKDTPIENQRKRSLENNIDQTVRKNNRTNIVAPKIKKTNTELNSVTPKPNKKPGRPKGSNDKSPRKVISFH